MNPVSSSVMGARPRVQRIEQAVGRANVYCLILRKGFSPAQMACDGGMRPEAAPIGGVERKECPIARVGIDDAV
jgi:hypothetical protein